ncbi:MAG: hypothetical protein Q8M24_14955 [Pseudolabrys sp.]|nr:hypothetical protein [Pseudolabrys sp.]
MRSSLRGALSAIVALVPALVAVLPVAPALGSDRALPMRFDLRLQGPAESCGAACKTFISASGAITAESGRDFARFMQDQNIGQFLKDAVVVLNSDGGSVLGAIALGREIRKAALATTVGRMVDLKADAKASNKKADIRAIYSPAADCESMCAFVMLGGVQRTVPPEARVMVHQIWLGDRRDDPTAATYSAEDLVLVQRDIGRLAQFTAEMGASIDLLDLALRIPPWEPLHAMTRDEIRRTKLATDDAVAAPPAAVALSPPATVPQAVAPQATPVTNGARVTPISGQRWTMVDRGGIGSLARQHPLTVEGDQIGNFDLVVACGADSDSFELSYIERRRGADGISLPVKLDSVNVRTNRNRAKLAVAASERHSGADELVSYAAGTVPAALIREFAGPGSHSMVIETTSKGMVTIIRIGNTGAQQSLPRLVSGCAKPLGARADIPVRKTGGMASAQ